MPELTDELLHAQLREWADDLAQGVPAWSPIVASEGIGKAPPDEPLRREEPGLLMPDSGVEIATKETTRRAQHRRRVVAGVVAATCAVVAMVVVFNSRSTSRSDSVVAAQGATTDRLYKASGILATAPDGSALLCQTSALLDDMARSPSSTTPTPPACDRLSIPVVGVDVSALPGVQTVGDQTFTASVVTVTGTWNGTALTATGPVTGPQEQRAPQATSDFSVPCADPPSGWPAMPTTLTGYTTAMQDLKAYEANHADTFAGSWSGPDQQTMVEAFTDDPASHTSELQAIYPRVCIIQGTRTLASLEAIRTDLTAGKMPNGNRAITSSTALAEDRTGPYVLRVTLLVDDPDVRAWLESRYLGAVVVDAGVLEPT